MPESKKRNSMRNRNPKLADCPYCHKDGITTRRLSKTHHGNEWLFECVSCGGQIVIEGYKGECCEKFNAGDYNLDAPLKPLHETPIPATPAESLVKDRACDKTGAIYAAARQVGKTACSTSLLRKRK